VRTSLTVKVELDFVLLFQHLIQLYDFSNAAILALAHCKVERSEVVVVLLVSVGSVQD
jgi:hypothetical protein